MAKAAPTSQELNINLLQKEEAAPGGGEIVNWVLNVGRYLVIATEIVALLTFALGIKFAADKNDLKQKTRALQTQIDEKSTCRQEEPESFCEDRFRNIQNKINQIHSYREDQFRKSEVFKELLARLPIGVSITNLVVEDNVITFTGSFPTSVHLQTLITSFSASEKINDLDIQELSSPTTSDPNFTFKASAELNPSLFETAEVASSTGTQRQ